MPRRENGFTLIELLVVIAILGIIAAVVALNVTGFFGKGTLQAANTELRQARTAIVSAMASAETGSLTEPSGNNTAQWSGEEQKVWIESGDTVGYDDNDFDAADYAYGSFRATYTVNSHGEIIGGTCNASGQWGSLYFCEDIWQVEPCS
jgi:prepilin-type N-terminal cleavage/methylation domain-containing protein